MLSMVPVAAGGTGCLSNGRQVIGIESVVLNDILLQSKLKINDNTMIFSLYSQCLKTNLYNKTNGRSCLHVE